MNHSLYQDGILKPSPFKRLPCTIPKSALSLDHVFLWDLDIRASRHLPSTMFGSARTAAGALFSTGGSEHAHLYGSTLLAPGGRRGCTSGCWRPDVTLPMDL